MPLPLIILVAAPAIGPSIMATVAAIAPPLTVLMVKMTMVMEDFFEPKPSSLSKAAQKSLLRQNKLLKTRKLEAEAIAEQAKKDADQSAANEKALKAQELIAATLLLDASHEIALTGTTLEAVSLTNQESIETLSGALSTNIERHVALVSAALAVPDKLEILTKELDDKTLLIESLNERLSLFQTEAATREAAMKEITSHVTELVALSHSQAETIQTLQAEQAELIDNIHEMAEELELLSRPNAEKDNVQAFPNRFFR